MSSFSQNSSKPINILNGTPLNIDVNHLISCEELPTGLWQKVNKSTITFTSSQITNFDTTVIGVGNANYKPLAYTPSYSEIIASLGFVPLNGTGNTSQYFRGDGSIATFPTIPPAQVQADFTQTNTSAVDYIKNKPLPDYTNTVAVAGGAGNAVFYITSDKTSTGTALYTNITHVNPIVNDSSTNFTYGWSYNPTTKALTVNSKAGVTGIVILGISLLGAPVNVANGTNIQVLVKGN